MIAWSFSDFLSWLKSIARHCHRTLWDAFFGLKLCCLHCGTVLVLVATAFGASYFFQLKIDNLLHCCTVLLSYFPPGPLQFNPLFPSRSMQGVKLVLFGLGGCKIFRFAFPLAGFVCFSCFTFWS